MMNDDKSWGPLINGRDPFSGKKYVSEILNGFRTISSRIIFKLVFCNYFRLLSQPNSQFRRVKKV